MKLFQLVQMNFAILGIHTSQSMNPFNHKILFGFTLFGSAIISMFMYILCEANTFFEYTHCICAIFVGIGVIINFAIFVFKTSKLIKFLESAEKNIVDGKNASKRKYYIVKGRRLLDNP